MISPSGVIYAYGRMKERILYHICVSKYIMPCDSAVYHTAQPYIIIVLLLNYFNFSSIMKKKKR